MKEDIIINENITIPYHELTVTASKSGGAGGQNVNKTNSKITIHWNIEKTEALSDEQKKRVMEALASELTKENELVVHNSETRSQDQNRKGAIDNLSKKIAQSLHLPKKRMKSKMPQALKEKRLKDKKIHSELKKSRSKKDIY